MTREGSRVNAFTMTVEACCIRWDCFTIPNPSSGDSKFCSAHPITVARAYGRNLFRHAP